MNCNSNGYKKWLFWMIFSTCIFTKQLPNKRTMNHIDVSHIGPHVKTFPVNMHLIPLCDPNLLLRFETSFCQKVSMQIFNFLAQWFWEVRIFKNLSCITAWKKLFPLLYAFPIYLPETMISTNLNSHYYIKSQNFLAQWFLRKF
jgi:hypothetical protein